MDLKKLPFANLARQSGRTAGLIVLVAVLSCALYAGSMIVMCLNNGLHSLETRLGADIIVAPKTAKSTTDLEQILIDGVPGYFYMDASNVDKIAQVEGVEKVSPQYYLATVKAGCCTMPVQVIGFDPETDFTIKPWIARSFNNELGLDDVVAGCNIDGAVGATIALYGVNCNIISKLDETGTSLDNAVFATNETLIDLIDASSKRGLAVLTERNPADVVSTIQVKVANDANVTNVLNDINLHVRGVTATATKSMTSDVSDSVAGVAGVVCALLVALWILAAVILVIVFSSIGKQRVKEFSILRVIGASRSALSRIVLTESLVVSAAGAIIGIAVAAFVVIAFNGSLEDVIGLPFLLPDVTTAILLGIAAFAISMVLGPVASALSARRLSKVDPGQTLREE